VDIELGEVEGGCGGIQNFRYDVLSGAGSVIWKNLLLSRRVRHSELSVPANCTVVRSLKVNAYMILIISFRISHFMEFVVTHRMRIVMSKPHVHVMAMHVQGRDMLFGM
jgi:hypothetical protein